MLRNKLSFLSVTLLASIAMTAYAKPPTHTLVAPACLLNQVDATYQTLATTPKFSLIEANELAVNKLAAAKHQNKTLCGGFVDVSLDWDAYKITHHNRAPAANFLNSYLAPAKSVLKATHYDISYEKQVTELLKQINSDNIWKTLSKLTSFEDRYANSETGKAASAWLKSQIEIMAKEAGRTDVSVTEVPTRGWSQNSIVAKIGEGTEPGIVIGGHMDTLSKKGWWETSPKPGADDDGSGTSTVMEVARTLISSGMHFKKPIYIVWYAAEEMGLVGSKNVVAYFKSKQIPVAAALQFDMTGWAHENEPTMWLINDDVDPALTSYVKQLISTYVKQPIADTKCGYECSDHASWTRGGFASAFPFEAKFGQDDPYIHTANDKMDVLSLSHMTNFAKLGVAFAVELAEPVG